MTVLLVHGIPETDLVWEPLRAALDGDCVAVRLPGFGVARPDGFGATKDDYAAWLADRVRAIDGPVDLVGHDLGALLVWRVASAGLASIRSWAIDVADIVHSDFAWPQRMRTLQQPGLGEQLLREERAGDRAARLVATGIPAALAARIAAARDDAMDSCILDFYRSAVPNVAASWWPPVADPLPPGLVLVLPDPPETLRRIDEVARACGATIADLGDLGHCWMAQDPTRVAAALRAFWASLPTSDP